MKLQNKGELQKTVFSHSSDIGFKGFTNLYKKCIAKAFSFIINDATVASDNPSLFRKNLLERIWKLIMSIDDRIRDEKL